ncbi:MAG TPA: Spy/CpxP family protein refolding chaperone [Stellaceae bacterium]|nr:Spy/CpxP family protein refolding chaperone [Stellaceae bacterium]
MIRVPRLVPLAAAAVICAPAFAFAQSTTSPAAPTHPAAPPAAAAPPGAAPSNALPGLPKDIQTRVEQHIKQLHAQLHITAAEEQQWNAFADVMRRNAADMGEAFRHREQEFASMNALQNMQSYAKIAEEHAERLQKLVTAFETLYNALPESQQKLADQVFRERAESRAKRRG